MNNTTNTALFFLTRTVIVGGVFAIACALAGPEVAKGVRDNLMNILPH